METPLTPTPQLAPSIEAPAPPVQPPAPEVARTGGFRAAAEKVGGALEAAYRAVVTGVGLHQAGLRPEAAPAAAEHSASKPTAGDRFDKLFHRGLGLTAAGLGVAAVATVIVNGESSAHHGMQLMADSTPIPSDPVNTVAPMPGHEMGSGNTHVPALAWEIGLPATVTAGLLVGRLIRMARDRRGAIEYSHPGPGSSPSRQQQEIDRINANRRLANLHKDDHTAGRRLGNATSMHPGHTYPPGYEAHPFSNHDPRIKSMLPPAPLAPTRLRAYWNPNHGWPTRPDN